MRQLVVKDLYTQKPLVYFTSIIWFIMFTNFFTDGAPIRHVFLLIFLAYWLVNYSNANTKSFEGESILLNSLPVTRRQLVLTKYVTALVWFSFAAVAVVMYIFLFKSFAPFPTRMINVSELFIAVSGFYILLSIFYPLLFKFGYQLASILAFILTLIGYIGLQTFMNMLENPRIPFANEIVATLAANKLGSITIFIIVSLLITLFSYVLSVRIYEKKDF